MTSMPPFTTPSDVTAVEGEVQIDGPAGITFSMTPAAASETGKRLLAASEQAERQQPGDRR